MFVTNKLGSVTVYSRIIIIWNSLIPRQLWYTFHSD